MRRGPLVEEVRHDPVVEEVRRVRRQLKVLCGNDLQRLFEFIRAGEATVAERVVDYGPRRGGRP